MSDINQTEKIKAVQVAIGTDNDGIPGNKTWSALFDLAYKSLLPVDNRSETNIATLHPVVRPYARRLITEAKKLGLDVKVISGTRSYAEQDALYAQGRTKSGPIVTNAKGGYSNHNFGIAFDIGIFEGSKYLEASKHYDTVGAIGKKLGLEWGGDWKSFTDKPHFQLRPYWGKGMSESELLAVCRSRVSKNIDIFA